MTQLEYGRQRPASRLKVRHVVVGAVLLGCILGSWTLGRSARERTQELLYVRQASLHNDSANTIVFESNPEIAQRLIDAGTHISLSRVSSAPAALREPECLRVLREAAGGNALEAVGALVFLHELVTPSGARRIVAVQFLPHYLDGRALPGAGLVAHIFEPGGLIDEPVRLGQSETRLLLPEEDPIEAAQAQMAEAMTAGPGRACGGIGAPVLEQAFDPWGAQLDSLRWYAGQPDQMDPAHFTIDYEIGGRRGTIDGYLSDDGGHVRMQARPQGVGAAGSSLFTRISGPGSLR